jgi:hypothetical protein
MVEYTSIQLQLIAPLLDGEGEVPLDSADYLITITSPVLSTPGFAITAPVKLTKRLRLNQIAYLKLLPSNQTIPALKYKVTYARAKTAATILAKEEWIVPLPPVPLVTELKLEPDSLTYDLPINFRTLVDLQANVTLPSYQVYQNRLIFLVAPPQLTARLTYNTYLTRADVVYQPTTWHRKQPSSAQQQASFQTGADSFFLF